MVRIESSRGGGYGRLESGSVRGDELLMLDGVENLSLDLLNERSFFYRHTSLAMEREKDILITLNPANYPIESARCLRLFLRIDSFGHKAKSFS